MVGKTKILFGVILLSIVLIGIVGVSACMCGDKIIDSGEECDDGNVISGDGCSSSCLIESCPLSPNDYDYVIVLNQKLVSKELYLDYAFKSPEIGFPISAGKYAVTLVARDYFVGRESDSQPNEQYTLSFLKNSQEVASTPATSDLQDEVSFAQVTELVTNDLYLPNGADAIQAFHAKYFDIPTSTQNSLTALCVGINRVQYCGDGIKEGNEECDDGNNVNGDGCDWMCKVEDQSICGNDVQEEGEQCDWGTYNGLICDPNYEGTCEWCTINCELKVEHGGYCGDGVCDAQESCSLCSEDCGTCPPTSVCGNGVQETGEQCDLGSSNGIICFAKYGETCEYCTTSCTIKEIFRGCGDGVREPCYEECDDGNNVNGDGCSSTCEIETPEPVCGNDIIESGEQCDLGSDNGKVCNPEYDESCDWCTSSCDLETEHGSYCGDGVCDAQEDCSLCSNDCGVCPPVSDCGNGVKESGEECDDGNNVNGDGCSSTCQTEEENNVIKKPIVLNVCNPNWVCSGWSECSGDVMTRSCDDKNNCEIEYNKPNEISACDAVMQAKDDSSQRNLFWFFAGVILLIILLIILVNLLR